MSAVRVFNARPADELEADLLACCRSRVWAGRMVRGRPYSDEQAIRDAADRISLDWAEVTAALAAHPRIGERAPGDSAEAAWSRREQSAAQTQDERASAALVEANKAYEDRFGHVFLIFASGRSQAEVLAAATARLGNDERTERAIVAGELKKIAALRLERLLDAL